MIYLASPYSHSDTRVQELRFEAVCRAAAKLIRSIFADRAYPSNLPTWPPWGLAVLAAP